MRRLVPFSSGLSIQLTADLQRDSKQNLRIEFEIQGDLSQIHFPESSSLPQRKEDLWKRTCFEIFFGPADGANYWEMNLSPSGDWNVYAFENYRAGMTPEPGISEVKIRTGKSAETFSLEALADLSSLALIPSMRFSAAAVIESWDGKSSYWAFQHYGKTPDFHLRESFVAQL